MDRPSNEYNLPPQNLEAEESILSACLLYPNESLEIVSEILKPDHFYRTAHQKIFKTILYLYNNKMPVDLVTLSNRLKQDGILEEIGGGTYLASIVNEIPISVNIEEHANIIIDKAAKRLTIQKCHSIAKLCFDDQESASDIIDKAQASVLEIESLRPETSTYEPISEILLSSLETLDERCLHKGQLTGIPTGFEMIDQLTWGLQPTDLIIIAARPATGKSSISLNIIRHAAVECSNSYPCGIFSLEMSKQQLSFKWLADIAKINTQKFKSGLFDRKEWESLTDAAGRLNGAPIYIDDSSGLSINEIRRRSRQMWKRHGVKLIIIDYIQLMPGTGQQNRNLEIGAISTGLKGLAKELNIPIIAISQLNRKVEDRNNKRPQMADLRDGGGIEQDADVIAFLYRDEVYNKAENNPLRGVAEFIIAKNRTGPTGTAHLSFIDKYASFYNLISTQQDSYQYADEIRNRY